MMEAAMIIRRMEEELRSDYQIELVEASTPQIHKALSNAVMYAISDNWRQGRQRARARAQGILLQRRVSHGPHGVQ